jgi:hypothetical protein
VLNALVAVVGLGAIAAAGEELDHVGDDVDARGVVAALGLELLEAVDRDLAPLGEVIGAGAGRRSTATRRLAMSVPPSVVWSSGSRVRRPIRLTSFIGSSFALAGRSGD